MVFMEDSERAAKLVSKTNLEVGLHLNFTTPFITGTISGELRQQHHRVITYLTKNKLSQVIYNPLLAGSFNLLFKSQQDEFMRLYGRHPDFYNGHHHMHLCANALLDNMIPEGARVRRSFTFGKGEKNIFNRLYRRYIGNVVSRRYISTDRFFSIAPIQDLDRLQKIFNHALKENVEIESHPENSEEIEFLLSDQYLRLMESVHVGNFQQIHNRS
jgi:predicted glycoside hydrolase/deacetylase ChbG (UPF0249 family)